MNTDMEQLQLGNITVDVVQKDIKNIHLSVYPPTGRVRISAPTRMDLDFRVGLWEFHLSKRSNLSLSGISLSV